MKKLFLTVSLLALASYDNTPAFAGSSEWFQTDGARIRLISLPAPDGKTIDAGLQIELAKGWKTYWRSPGASGLPPEISFKGSTNIAATKIDFPIPETFGDAENLTAGYKSSVTFPIRIEPLFAGRAVTLNVGGLVGICGEICLPVQFKFSITEDGKGISSRDVASALLSSRSKLMQAARDDFRIEHATYLDDGKRGLEVSARLPEGTTRGTLFVEGPENWYLTPVHAHTIKNGTASFRVSLNDVPKGAEPTTTKLRISLVANGEGVEQELIPTAK